MHYSTYESKTLLDGEKILAPHLPGRKVKIFTSNTESASVYVSQKASWSTQTLSVYEYSQPQISSIISQDIECMQI